MSSPDPAFVPSDMASPCPASLPAWAQPRSSASVEAPEPGIDALADLERRLRVQPHPGAATAQGPVADREPDWATARDACARVLATSRDLRAAVGWTRCALALDGLPGLAAGLLGLAAWLDECWAEVHPRVDAREDPSADERRHLLLNLSPEAASSQPTPDAESLARALRAARAGTNALREPVAVRDLDRSTLAWSEEGARVLRAADEALDALRRLDGAFLRATGQGLRLPGLQRLLDRVVRVLRQVADAAAATGASPDGGSAPAAGQAPGLAPPADAGLPMASAAPGSRADAAQRLMALATWVRHHEPSSPAPLLIERAAALLQMDFAEIVRTLLPAARAQVEALAGAPLDPDPR